MVTLIKDDGGDDAIMKAMIIIMSVMMLHVMATVVMAMTMDTAGTNDKAMITKHDFS